MMDLGVKLSAESQNAEGKLQKISQEIGKTAYNLSNELMTRVFGKGDYSKAELKDQVDAYVNKRVKFIPKVPHTSTDLRVLHGMLSNEKSGLSKVTTIHLDNGTNVSVTETLNKKIKSFEKKLASLIELK